MHSLNNFPCNGKYTGTFSSQELFLRPIAYTRNFFECNQLLEFFFGGENWLHAPFAIINLERCCLVFSIIGRIVILVQYENAVNGHFCLHKCLWGFFPHPPLPSNPCEGENGKHLTVVYHSQKSFRENPVGK